MSKMNQPKSKEKTRNNGMILWDDGNQLKNQIAKLQLVVLNLQQPKREVLEKQK